MSNGIFFHNISNGLINYHNKNPLTILTNKEVSDTPVKIENNITLIEAQKFLIKDTSLCLFEFTPNNNSENISRNTLGNARFFNNTNATIINGSKSIFKDKTAFSDSTYTTQDLNYFGELDFIEFSISETDIINITQSFNALNIQNSFIEYYFYIWEDINGPWYNGNTLSMIPNKNNFVDSNNNINNPLSNSINTVNDISATYFYTYNYISSSQSDTSSNYIKIYKTSGYNSNDNLPSKKSIRIVSPKYTKFNFIWTYKICNSNYSYNNSIYNLEGNFPFFTPNLQIENLSYNNFSNLISNLTIDRHIFPQYKPNVSYNDDKTLQLSISEEDKNMLIYSYIERYKPENQRMGNEYISSNNEIIKHLYENNEILSINLNFYVFINKNEHQSISNNSNLILSNNNLNSEFTEILSDKSFILNDNSFNIIELDNYRIDYFNISENLQEKYTNDVIYQDLLSNTYDLTSINHLLNGNEYYAYEKVGPPNTDSISGVNWMHIVRSYRNDLINVPKWGHYIKKNNWKTFYKKVNILPDSDHIIYDISNISQSTIDVRWNFTSRIYNYSKENPGNPSYINIYDISLNSGISPTNLFDYTQAGITFYPTNKLDVKFDKLIDTGNQLYYNYHVSLNENTINDLYNNIKFNYGISAEPIIHIYGITPKKRYIEDESYNIRLENLFYNTNTINNNNEDSSQSIDVHFNNRPDSISFFSDLNNYFFSELYNQNIYIYSSEVTEFNNIKHWGFTNPSQFFYSNKQIINTRDIDYKLYDVSYSFYNAAKTDISFNLRNYNIPYHLDTFKKYDNFVKDLSLDTLEINDISGVYEYFHNEPKPEDTYVNMLLSGIYIYEWTYDISLNNQIIDLSNVLNKGSNGTYSASKTFFDVSKNIFINSTLDNNILMSIDQSRLLLHTTPINQLFNTTKQLLTDSLTPFSGRELATSYKFSFTLFTPNNEISQSSSNGWSLNENYSGVSDPRIIQQPAIYNGSIDVLKNSSGNYGYINGYHIDFNNDENICILSSIFEYIQDPSSIFYQPSSTIRSITSSTNWLNPSNISNSNTILATYNSHNGGDLNSQNIYLNHNDKNCPHHSSNGEIYDVSSSTIISGYTALPLLLTNSKTYTDISNIDVMWDKRFLWYALNKINLKSYDVKQKFKSELIPITFPISYDIGQYYIDDHHTLTTSENSKIKNPSYSFELKLDNNIDYSDLSYSNIIVGTDTKIDLSKNNQTFIGLHKDGSFENDGWVYYHNNNKYNYRFSNGTSYTIKWIIIHTSGNNYDVHITINNRLIFVIENGGIPEKEFNYLGYDKNESLPRDGSWNYAFDYNFFNNKGAHNNTNIQYWESTNINGINDNQINTYKNRTHFYKKNRIELQDIAIFKLYNTDMYKIITANELNLSKFPLSSSHRKNNNIIPYLSKVDYKFTDIWGPDTIFDSLIQEEINDIELNSKIPNWELDPSNNNFKFKNYSKIKYGKLFFLSADTVIAPEPFFPLKPNLSFDANNNSVKIEVSTEQQNFIKYSLIDDWSVEFIETNVQYRFFGFIDNPQYNSTNNIMIATGLPPNDGTQSSENQYLNKLKTIDIDNTQFDFDFIIPLKQDYEALKNDPNISDPFKIFNICLTGGKIWGAYTYIINSNIYNNSSPNTSEFFKEILFKNLDISNYYFYFNFNPKAPILSIKNSSTINLKLPDNSILDLFNSLMDYSDGISYFNDISEITLYYYLWSTSDISNNLPNNYNGEIDRLKHNPNTFINSNGFVDVEDLSYSQNLQNNYTALITKTYNSNIGDLNTYTDAYDIDFQNINIDFTSNYQSQYPIPYLARWSVKITLKNGNNHYSDINDIIHPQFYRKNNIQYQDISGNKIITNTNYNKYNYGLLFNPDTSLPPPPPPKIFICDPSCKKVPVITKEKNVLTEKQRYSNAVQYKRYSKL